MSKKVYLQHTGTPQNFDFDPHGSGRYREGSGENPHQHGFHFLAEIEKLRKEEGLSDTEIAKRMGYSTGEWRAKRTVERNAYKQHQLYQIQNYKSKGWSNTAIANKLGISEGAVRSMLKNPERVRDAELENTVNVLKESFKNKEYIDVSEGSERMLGISRTKMDAALAQLKKEGYEVKPIQVKQINSNTGQKTTTLVLAPKDGLKGKALAIDIYNNLDKVSLITEYHSEDNGLTWGNIEKPVSIDSKRLEFNYADDKGIQPKDGVIELRPGVEDISLGNSKYAQVRIAVDDKYYIKGMAIYSNDLPKGVDIRVNTNKSEGAPIEKVLKPMKTVDGTENGPIDWDNPFGATIMAGGQRHYVDKDGNKHLSAINKVNDEGSWGEWDRTLAAQFLSKQDLALAKKQLNITYLNKKDEFEEIKNIQNSTVRQKMLQSFADDCDTSSADLKAAAMPRQASQVLLPLASIKENEIYAPNFNDGEHVCLVRYPHSGPVEIVDLKVNNKNKEAISIFGKTPKDCVVVNPKVAPKLSGADFDGDSVVVIPNKNGKVIKHLGNTNPSPELLTLQDFDTKTAFPGYPGMKKMTEKGKGLEMGKAANLITDMMVRGCSDDELVRAIKYSMVVVDAYKHGLDWKGAAKEYNIKELRHKYQHNSETGKDGGASTLLSRAKSPEWVDERKLYVKTDPVTGKKIFTETGRTKNKVKKLPDGTKVYLEEEEKVQTRSKKMFETDDAFSLASDPKNPLPMEEAYGIYANRMKKMANEARLEALNIKAEPVSKAARIAYAKEVKDLESKLNIALSNAPYERQAQRIANVEIKAKRDANPSMTDSEIRKKGQQALNAARNRCIPGGKKERIKITEKEWEAINANAIPSTQLKRILNNTNLDDIKELATPREKVKGLTPSKIASAKAKLNSGYYTQADVAKELGISVTTLMKYIK